MSYLTPAQILDQAAYKYASGEYQPPQCRASTNMGVVPAQLHKESPYYSTSRTSQVESLISSHYAGQNSRHDSNASRPAHHHHSATSVQRQRSMPMIGFSGGPSYAPSIPVTSSESHDPYPSMSSVVPAPLSERRNSQDTSPFHECTHMKHKGSGGGTSYAYPDYLNLPPDYRSASKDTHRQFEYPGYLNLPPGYSRDSNNIQKQTKYPDYLNLPEEYRTSQAQHGPIRSSGYPGHTQNPYPFTSSSHHPAQSIEPPKRRRGDPQLNRYPADPFPIVQDGRGPTNHIRVPQRVFYDETDLNRCMSYSKPITFKMKNFAELGVRLFDCLDENHFRHPNIEDKDAKLFSTDEVYREMRLKILWPGYSEYPFTRRINIRKGEMTRISMLFNVATAIADFVKKVQSDRDCTCERGLEMWKLTGRERLNVDQFILTGLVHRGGPNWQPEIWCPTFT
ncbi:uncharacterized protein C8R40DRAFT_546458 [Lentinula edodes]|uniref:uncharacterized protein n=1 Tax=Lentinula edodes TaxID=5353 RepID=UPI001E8E95CC|nr:uncharacterized protein C8R40DRAFT_546458 [Lentinula edodes]KAH7871617.1 hypothetical protein C8R40DRAFT_546458 [Lentinula edodes]